MYELFVSTSEKDGGNNSNLTAILDKPKFKPKSKIFQSIPESEIGEKNPTSLKMVGISQKQFELLNEEKQNEALKLMKKLNLESLQKQCKPDKQESKQNKKPLNSDSYLDSDSDSDSYLDSDSDLNEEEIKNGRENLKKRNEKKPNKEKSNEEKLEDQKRMEEIEEIEEKMKRLEMALENKLLKKKHIREYVR